MDKRHHSDRSRSFLKNPCSQKERIIMQCLNCHKEMFRVTEGTGFSRILYDVCRQCGALWLGERQLERLIRRSNSMNENFTDLMQEVGVACMADPANIKRFHLYRKCLQCQDQTMTKMHLIGDPHLI